MVKALVLPEAQSDGTVALVTVEVRAINEMICFRYVFNFNANLFLSLWHESVH